MKRIIAVLLCITLILGGCAIKDSSNRIEEPDASQKSEISFGELSDPELLPYISNQVYTGLEHELNNTEYVVEDVQSIYISKEYLEELEYNSKENVYFGFTLSELASQFEGTNYVFSLDENGETIVQEMEEYDDTYDKAIKDVAIGAGVILVCVVVTVVTKNPAAAVGAGKTIKGIFAVSSTAAKAGTSTALKSAAFGGTIAAYVESINTNDVKEIAKAGLLGASEGFKWGAIFGTAKGLSDGIKIVKNTHYFAEGTKQAQKYVQGVEFSQGADGHKYPRFEKWAKKTVKFDMPTKEAALNHTGLSGNYYYDSTLANKMCGYSTTPEGYVWHHVEDMRTMILVPQDLHSPAFGGMYHKGGASLIKEFLGL